MRMFMKFRFERVLTQYSAGIDFRRQSLTSVDVDPRTVRVKIFILTVDP